MLDFVVETMKKIRGPQFMRGLELSRKSVLRLQERKRHTKNSDFECLKEVGEAMGVDYRLLLPSPDYEMNEGLNETTRQQIGWKAEKQNVLAQNLNVALKELHFAVREYVLQNSSKQWVSFSNNTYSLGATLRLTIYPGDFYELWKEYKGGKERINCDKMAKEAIAIIKDGEQDKYKRINRLANGCSTCACGIQF